MLLAIDTSAGTSVALVDLEAGILAEASSDDTRRHAEVIGELIQLVLDQSGVAVTDLSGVVAGMGPGPFTGLRVGIAAARTFALGAGKIVVPVASHDAIAFGATGPVLVASDARRSELYWSTYSGSDDAGLLDHALHEHPTEAVPPGALCDGDGLDVRLRSPPRRAESCIGLHPRRIRGRERHEVVAIAVRQFGAHALGRPGVIREHRRLDGHDRVEVIGGRLAQLPHVCISHYPVTRLGPAERVTSGERR